MVCTIDSFCVFLVNLHEFLHKRRVVDLVDFLVFVNHVKTVVSEANAQLDRLWVVLVSPVKLVETDTQVL